MSDAPLLIGLAGGTGSGKTTVAAALHAHAPDRVTILPQDAYYRAQPGVAFETRAATNYDQPAAFDHALLLAHLDALLAREPIHRPVYDFARHDRDDATVPVAPTPVVIMEGILVLHDAALRERFALKVYVDAPRDERFIRRLERDVRERGRSTDSVIAQYRDTVGPMHDLYVEPSKQHADLIVPQGGRNHAAMAVLSSFVERAVHGAPPPVPPSPVPRG